MDDRDGLENRCGGNSTVGSNPTPSAILDARWVSLDQSRRTALIRLAASDTTYHPAGRRHPNKGHAVQTFEKFF